MYSKLFLANNYDYHAVYTLHIINSLFSAATGTAT